jgi:hypothetical protein
VGPQPERLSLRKELAAISARAESQPCRFCGKPKWFHLQCRSGRNDDGHYFGKSHSEGEKCKLNS